MLSWILVVFLAVTQAEDCWLGDWTPWSDCSAPNGCNSPQDYNPESWKLAAAEFDEGRLWMQRMISSKSKRAEMVKACRAEGTCPELDVPASQSYVPCEGGMAGPYPCNNVNQLSFLNFVDMAGPTFGANAEGNDIWGWVDPLDNEEYAIMGMTSGTAFIRVTDPRNPVPLAFLPSYQMRNSIWRDMKVYKDHAFIISEASNHGMQVYDMRKLRDMNGDQLQIIDDYIFYANVGQSHNIVINEATGYAYIVGAVQQGAGKIICSGGLHAVDISDPANPTFAGCFGTDGYVHDAECVVYTGPDTRYTDKEICFCYNENSLTIVDATVKSSMQLISKVTYSGVRYTHQGWLTADMSVLLLDDELDEYYSSGNEQYTKTYIYDVNNLEDPILRTIFRSSELSIDHNQYVLNGHTYQSNYEAGLRVLEIDQDNFQLSEVAYFDVYPPNGHVDFYGTWSNYPYLPSGVVLLTSIEYGFFVVEVDFANVSSTQERRRQVNGEACEAPSSEKRTCYNNC